MVTSLFYHRKQLFQQKVMTVEFSTFIIKLSKHALHLWRVSVFFASILLVFVGILSKLHFNWLAALFHELTRGFISDSIQKDSGKVVACRCLW